MKSGVAVQLRLAAQLAEPSRDVTYVFYESEEVEAERNGLLRLSRTRPELLAGDFAVLMEPSSGVIEGGCQGTLRVEVTVAGQRAHTARSWMGVNAIHQAADVLAVLRAYTPREPEVDGLRYREGLNAVAITGGVAGNVVPDECVVTVNHRFAPDRTGRAPISSARCSLAGRSSWSTWPKARGPAWVTRPLPPSWPRSAPTWGRRGPSSAGPTWPGSPRWASRPSTTARACPSWPTPRGSTSRPRPSPTARTGCGPG